MVCSLGPKPGSDVMHSARRTVAHGAGFKFVRFGVCWRPRTGRTGQLYILDMGALRYRGIPMALTVTE